MKKLLLIIPVVVCAVAAHGQFLLKAGLSAATTATDNPDGSDLKEQLKAGFLAGAGYQLTFGNFAVQPELLFVQKGSTVKSSFVDGPVSINETTKVTLNYLELPVLFRYMFGPDALRIFVNAGPSFAVGLSGKGSYESSIDLGNGPVNENYDFKIKFENEPEGYEGNDLYIENKTDVGLQLGGGVIVADKIMIDLRYGMGFSEWGNEKNTKNRALQLSVGFLFGR